jgi:excisionase family DNA binding protein
MDAVGHMWAFSQPPEKKGPEKEWLTLKEAALELQVDYKTVWRWIQEERIEATKPGRVYLIRRSEVNRLRSSVKPSGRLGVKVGRKPVIIYSDGTWGSDYLEGASFMLAEMKDDQIEFIRPLSSTEAHHLQRKNKVRILTKDRSGQYHEVKLFNSQVKPSE